MAFLDVYAEKDVNDQHSRFAGWFLLQKCDKSDAGQVPRNESALYPLK